MRESKTCVSYEVKLFYFLDEGLTICLQFQILQLNQRRYEDKQKDDFLKN